MIRLYSYFRSSTAYRVRIALNLKQLPYDILPVNLLEKDHRADDYLTRNPLGRVPTLEDGPLCLSQSMAIIEYLDEIVPQPPLIYGDAAAKAYIRQLAQVIACDIHPLTNLNVLQYLTAGPPGLPEARKIEWYKHFAMSGLQAFETMLAGRHDTKAHDFCAGDTPSLADLCLIPQMYNMRRFAFPLEDFPHCRRIEKNCMARADFQKAAPEQQPDAPDGLDIIHGPNAPFLNA